MSETNQLIIDMILKNATVNEIAKVTGLSNKQLFHRLSMLKMKGYEISRKYYYDGEIVYKLNHDFVKEKDVSIITSKEDTKFEAVFISDIHLANQKERLDLLNQVYEFCIKEGIHIIINCGDLLDGFLGSYKDKKIYTAEEQIEYLLKHYPFDKNILNFICLGNHDYSILKKEGQNLETILLNHRHDIVSLGYGFGRLKVKNDVIMVRHPKTAISNSGSPTNKGFIISGHTHRSMNISNKNYLNIQLPQLCDLNIDEYSLPGFVRASISFSNGYFFHSWFQQYVFLDRMYKVNESKYNLYANPKDKFEGIQNEEERVSIIENVKIFKK